jgi:hypothetical protein
LYAGIQAAHSSFAGRNVTVPLIHGDYALKSKRWWVPSVYYEFFRCVFKFLYLQAVSINKSDMMRQKGGQTGAARVPEIRVSFRFFRKNQGTEALGPA